jgi:hypothetical protein
MKTSWDKAVILCVVIAVVAITTYHYSNDPAEAARSYMLSIIDEALLESTEDTPDYIEPNGSRLYFQNSISLQTLRDAVKNAEMYDRNISTFLDSGGPIFFIGEHEIGYAEYLYCDYEGTWWIAKVDSKYTMFLRDYIREIGEKGESFGVYLKMPFEYDQYINENMRKISQEDIFMAMGDSVTLYANVNRGEDLLLFAHVIFVRDITAYKPDGSMSLRMESSSIAADRPLAIPIDVAGTWSVTVTRMTDEELDEKVVNLMSKDAQPPWFCSLLLASRPSVVELELPKVTDDPYLLSRLVAELPGTVVVTERGMLQYILSSILDKDIGKSVSLSKPLADGRHDLGFHRVTPDGRVSKMTFHTLRVDSRAPEITIPRDFVRETNSPRVWLKLKLSDNVLDVYINGEEYEFASGRPRTEFHMPVPLEMGENLFEVRAVSYAGHETVRTVAVTRS